MTEDEQSPCGIKSSLSASARVIEALRARGPLTRRELSEQTGYSRATVSQVIGTLMESGTLDEVKGSEGGAGRLGRGRPPVKVRMHPRRATQGGLEIGCTMVAFALCDNAGQLILKAGGSIPVELGFPARVERLIGMVFDQAHSAGIDLQRLDHLVLGISAARAFRAERRAPGSAASESLGWREGQELCRMVSAAFAAQVSIGNSMAMRALAEATHFREHEADLLLLNADHGIGGGLVLGGALQAGSRGFAGELGHLSAEPNGPPCYCGNRGCLETIGSMAALLTASGAGTVSELAEAFRAGRHGGLADRAIGAISRVAAEAVTLCNPKTLVLGGSVFQLPGFYERVSSMVRDSVPEWVSDSLSIENAVENEFSGAIGAMSFAFQSKYGRLAAVTED